jgi:SAM-dependent methyltransferase
MLHFLRRVPVRLVRMAQAQARGHRRVRREFQQFRSLCRAASLTPPNWADRYLVLEDATTTTAFDPHYTYHPAWAARILAHTRPTEHVDISSLLQFSTLVSAFVPVRFYDYRPAQLALNGLQCEHADLLALPFEDNSVDSLSCMHVIEHIGLGRYGEPLDPLGDRKAMRELARVLAPGGQLLFVTPVGKPRLQFNAHRIYSYEQIQEGFSSLTLREWALLPDDFTHGLLLNPNVEVVEQQQYACGCFCFEKPLC